MELAFDPADGDRGPAQGILGSNRTGIAEAVTNRRRIRRKTISFTKSGGHLKAGVLTKLQKEPEIVGEGKLLISTRDSCLQRLLYRLLGTESNRRV